MTQIAIDEYAKRLEKLVQAKYPAYFLQETVDISDRASEEFRPFISFFFQHSRICERLFNILVPGAHWFTEGGLKMVASQTCNALKNPPKPLNKNE